jgi:hypothetical protein
MNFSNFGNFPEKPGISRYNFKKLPDVVEAGAAILVEVVLNACPVVLAFVDELFPKNPNATGLLVVPLVTVDTGGVATCVVVDNADAVNDGVTV